MSFVKKKLADLIQRVAGGSGESEPAAALSAAALAGADALQLPLTPLLSGLSPDLRARIVATNTAGRVLSLPADSVLAQLQTGSVKISFGELRQRVPGVFVPGTPELDAKMIALPLNQILAQLNPEDLSRRAVGQKKVQVSDDIASPFGASSAGVALPPPLEVVLGALSGRWPESLRKEIDQLGLRDALVALPLEQVELSLQRGRAVFAWREIRAWIPSVPGVVSVHDNLQLELPLSVLVPLFFARKNGPEKVPQKTAVSEEIPTLFCRQPSSAPLGLSAVETVASVPDANYFSGESRPQTTDSEFWRRGGTDFLSRAATPAEVVARAMELPAVAGAVVALPDGLRVASQIPAGLNGDTFAAFIPQIFTRVKQCSQELRMGEMNNLSFTAGNVPWKIFRVNAVYFAAFGRANEALPGAELAALAALLDRQPV
jgi:predicted regulator of Ras-like GTPase activity (Roadblock/LC7/MglB family)